MFCFRQSRQRLAVHSFLFLAFLMAVFLLSGVTAPATAVRGIYILKLHYTTPPTIGSDVDEDSSNNPSPKPPFTVGLPQAIPKVDPIPRSTTSVRRLPYDVSTKTIRARAALPTELTIGGNPDPPIYRITNIEIDVQKSRIQPREPADEKGEDHDTDDIDHNILSLNDVNLDVYFGYYGFCIGGKTTDVRCMNKRPSSVDELKTTLFGVYDKGGAVNSTLTQKDDPQNLLSLGLALQAALSPVPLIISVIAIGSALLVSIYISLSSLGSYAGIGSNVFADKLTLFISIIGFLHLLIAVTFLKVAGDIADSILNGSNGSDGSDGSDGNDDGFLVEVAGVKATPGYHALRIGSAGLVMVGIVIVMLGWGLGFERREREEREGEGEGGLLRSPVGWAIGKVLGRRGRDDGPAWKASISRPMPVFEGVGSSGKLAQGGHYVAGMGPPQVPVGSSRPFMPYV
ncbi:hypothetical protein BDZ91DRAFT_765022 [Kalaharituber pfeilii]|nr:hypothetical protein BDZ91DRAFT_765022 [Kalaharituber pfeilii]